MRLFGITLLGVFYSFFTCQESFAQINFLSSSPVANVIDVAKSDNIILNFDAVVDVSTAVVTNVVITGNQTGVINGVLSGGGTTSLTFDPTTNFKAGEIINIQLTSGIESGGVALTNPFTFSFIVATGSNTGVFIEHLLSDTADAAFSVVVGDVDGDGDLDVISGSNNDDKIAWYENDGGSTPTFIERLITDTVNATRSVEVGDVDGDGDMDVLSASMFDDKIAWYDNDGSVPPVFTERLISDTADGAQSIEVGDLDGDGDLDVLSASFSDDKIAWYDNDGSVPPVFTERLISNTANGAKSVKTGDVNGDGYLDVLSASELDGQIVWYENDGMIPPTFIGRLISDTADLARSVAVGDLDGDGDLDVLSASSNDDKVVWYVNDGGVVPVFTEQLINDMADGAVSVTVGDSDGDGDLDVFLASFDDDKITWYENNGAVLPTFTERLISDTADGAISVDVGDVDGDGDLDVLSASLNDDKIVWYEKTGLPLPIELVNFNAVVQKDNTVGISWETVTEINNDYFTLERSQDGMYWESVVQVKGAGNSFNDRYYTTKDATPYLGTSYYRLKQTDFDGRFSYSKIEAVRINENVLEVVRFYPNPSDGQLTIFIDALANEKGVFKLYDEQGKELVYQGVNLVKGLNEISRDYTYLSKGVYFIKISASEKTDETQVRWIRK